MRVLQIEDDDALARTVEKMLHAKGYSCDTARLGEVAVELAARNRYDLILLDVMLPDMDGYEVLRRLRAAEIHTPVVIQSALVGRNDLENGAGFGVRDYLLKPFDGQELSKRIETAINNPEPLPERDDAGGDAPGKAEDRHKTHPHRAILKSAQIISLRMARPIDCIVVNMSEGGAALQPLREAEVPDTFAVKMEAGETYRCRVCWRHGNKIGVRFEDRDAP